MKIYYCNHCRQNHAQDLHGLFADHLEDHLDTVREATDEEKATEERLFTQRSWWGLN